MAPDGENRAEESREAMGIHAATVARDTQREGNDPGAAGAGPERAAEEVAPRPIDAGARGNDATAPPAGVPGAVDENRPADLTGQMLPADLSAPRVQPNVLQRQHVIAAHGQAHTDTAGQELVETTEQDEQDRPNVTT